ncbi:hypothetical protein MMA231_02700 [Asticcacaulis sp. MM231]|uniref:hypothetical protein n=1 Tax=Asticcacaulis sp. MM231 TaxID=3157666 RepID=UPI0032D57F76
MTAPAQKDGYDLAHQQKDVLDYITDIAHELANVAARAGCDTLSHDLKQAIIKSRGLGDTSAPSTVTPSEDRPQERL